VILRDALCDESTLVQALMRTHITTAVYGGEVYYAESSSGEVLGVAVWFGPNQLFLDTYVSFNCSLLCVENKPRVPLEKGSARLDGTNSWKG
jgi:hypothetical protein